MIVEDEVAAEEDGVNAAAELWLLVCEYVEVGVVDVEGEDHAGIDIEGIEIDGGAGAGGT